MTDAGLVRTLRGVAGWWDRCDVTARDLPLAVALVAASFLPVLRGHGTQVGDLATRALDVPAVAVVALEALPLAVRRRLPAVCLGLVSLGFAADQLAGYHTVAGTALPIALLSAAAHLERFRWAVAVAVSAGYVPLAVALDRAGSGEGLAGFATFYLAMVIAWAIGTWLRRTRIIEAERRRLVAEATRAAERTRIARDLHDVVTHHVTAMIVQAEAARHLTAVPERLDEALAAVSDTGRSAVADLRDLLDLLDPRHGAGPGAPPPVEPTRTEAAMVTPEPVGPVGGDLSALVEQARRAGQPVTFEEEGWAGMGGAEAGEAAYRVVQEALTNALKYANGRPTQVRIDRGRDEITVMVTTGGPDGQAVPVRAPTGGSGRGLVGLRQRVDLLGGELDAGVQPDGGFVVRARIPGERHG